MTTGQIVLLAIALLLLFFAKEVSFIGISLGILIALVVWSFEHD
jgi:hypothetical protein